VKGEVFLVFGIGLRI